MFPGEREKTPRSIGVPVETESMAPEEMMMAFLEELRRLNKNLEGLDLTLKTTKEVLEDLETMIAPLLGYRVKKKSDSTL